MKHGKRLTARMKKDLADAGYDPNEWLYVKYDDESLTLVHKVTKEVKVIRW